MSAMDNMIKNEVDKTLTPKISVSKKSKAISLILLILVGTFTNYIYVLTVYVQPLSEYHGWSMNMIVMAFSVSYVVMIPAYAVSGWVSAKFGMKKILAVSAAAYGLSILLSGLVTSVYLFIFFMGVLSSFAMYGVFMASLMLINILFPDIKGTAMGLLYGFQTLGAAAFSPLANFFIMNYSVKTALIIQGIAFTVVMLVCSLFVKDPTGGDKELMMRMQQQADEEEKADALSGKAEPPSLRWKSSLKHKGVWLLVISIILIQMFGNVLASDMTYLATTHYNATTTAAAFLTTVFSVAAAVGAIVIGIVSDKIGPYKTTFLLGIIDGILLLILAFAGADSFTLFIVMASIQGFTYNGMCTINPVIITDTFHFEDMGAMMAITGVAFTIVAIIGPQMGLSLSFVPMLIVCAVCSIAGGFLTKYAGTAFNKYYKLIGSKCRVK